MKFFLYLEENFFYICKKVFLCSREFFFTFVGNFFFYIANKIFLYLRENFFISFLTEKLMLDMIFVDFVLMVVFYD